MKSFVVACFFMCLSIGDIGWAQQSLPPAPLAYQQLDDSEAEARAQALMETLRCLKCQSQSIADSDAPMAGDMRHQVRSRIAAGEEPEAIRGWLVERYGDYVSYAPKVSRTTWPLFAIPLLLILVALLIFRRRFMSLGESGDGIDLAENSQASQASKASQASQATQASQASQVAQGAPEAPAERSDDSGPSAARTSDVAGDDKNTRASEEGQ